MFDILGAGMEGKLRNFIEKLAKTKSSDNAFNMFSFDVPANGIRRNNLFLYFMQMAKRKPEVLLVGEAPGYQGSRWTGVNFCSEHIITNGIEEIGMFGAKRGYKKTNEWEKVWKEPSATIVWGAMLTVSKLPLIWASYPFHPFESGKPLTNRAPTNEELVIGRPFIGELIEIFKIKKVIAVGNKAEVTLGKMGINAPKVRHPSHGGKNDFMSGLKNHLS